MKDENLELWLCFILVFFAVFQITVSVLILGFFLVFMSFNWIYYVHQEFKRLKKRGYF